MVDFRDEQLSGSTFEHVDLSGSRFRQVDLSDARLRSVALHRVSMNGVELCDVDITGELRNVVVNGVDIAPLVTAELDRRDPRRVAMRPEDADGFRAAWQLLEQLWAETVERARGLPEELLHESVDGEWSFVETLRHLVFATESWVGRGMLGDPSPWHPLSLPWDEMPDTEGVPRDRTVRPSLEEVLALRRDRRAMVQRVLEELTDDDLAGETTPVPGPGWPPPEPFPVKEVLLIVLNEEWEHRRFAERDLAVLESRPR